MPPPSLRVYKVTTNYVIIPLEWHFENGPKSNKIWPFDYCFIFVLSSVQLMYNFFYSFVFEKIHYFVNDHSPDSFRGLSNLTVLEVNAKISWKKKRKITFLNGTVIWFKKSIKLHAYHSVDKNKIFLSLRFYVK